MWATAKFSLGTYEDLFTDQDGCSCPSSHSKQCVLEDEAECKTWKTVVAPQMIPMGLDSPLFSAKAISDVPHIPISALSSDAAANAPCSMCWTCGLC